MNLEDPRGLDRTRVLQMISAYMTSRALYVASKLAIADLLAQGPLTLTELATRTKSNAPALARVLRALCGVGLFGHDGLETYELRPAGELLRSDIPGSLRNLSLSHGEDQYAAWSEVMHSVETGEPAYAKVHGAKLFEHLEANPKVARVFNGAMGDLVEMRWRDIVPGFDFTGVKTVCDVGGGDGSLLARILEAHPHLSGHVYDRDAALVRAPQVLAEAGVQGRCTTEAGDFFETVPRGADTYVLSCVLFDWDDDACVRILSNVRAAMGDEGRLLVYETAMPEGGSHYFGKFFDLNMLVVTGGRVRTESEHAALMARAGLAFVRARWGSFGTVLEGKAA